EKLVSGWSDDPDMRLPEFAWPQPSRRDHEDHIAVLRRQSVVGGGGADRGQQSDWRAPKGCCRQGRPAPAPAVQEDTLPRLPVRAGVGTLDCRQPNAASIFVMKSPACQQGPALPVASVADRTSLRRGGLRQAVMVDPW